MSDRGTAFPAFLRLEYDGSSRGASDFQRAVNATFDNIDTRAARFRSSVTEIGNVLSAALKTGLSGGALDLGVDKFRQAAAEARLHEQALRDLQRTSAALAAETGDTTQATRDYQNAIASQLIEAQQASRAAETQVATYTRLQAAVEASASAQSRLAAAYRETFAEQAKAARQEVSARGYQDAINASFAPGLTGKATDQGAGFSALAEQAERTDLLVQRLNADLALVEAQFARTAQAEAAAAELAARAQADHAAQLEALRRAEAGAAEGATLLAAIHRGTALEAGRTSKSYSDVAAAFAEVDRGAARYAARLEELKAALDPAYYAQRRFDEEMGFAREALARGDISAAQYGQRMQALAAEAQQNATSTRGQRFAYIQLGQQMQDVAIQAQLGTNAFVILAQQGSQAAFALTGLAGSANKTEAAVGRIATMLSGPWGAAALVAISLAGSFATELFKVSEAEEAAEKAAKDHKQAIEALQKALEQSIQTAQDKARADFIAIETERQSTIALRGTIQALIEKKQRILEIQQLEGLGTATNSTDAAQREASLAAAQSEIDILKKQLKDNQAKIDSLSRSTNIARGNLIGQVINDLSTPEGRVNSRYDKAEQAAKLAGGTDAEVARRLRDLEAARKAELDAIKRQEQELRKKNKVSTAGDATSAQVTKLILGSFGGTVTSANRSANDNARIGGAAGSYHLSGRAIDFVPAGGVNAISRDQIRSVMQAAGLTVKELLGPGDKGHSDHWHVAWSGGKDSLAVDKALQDYQDKRQRADEELQRSADQLISKYDETAAAVIEYRDALANIELLFSKGKITPEQRKSFTDTEYVAFFDKLRANEKKKADEIAKRFEVTSDQINSVTEYMEKRAAIFQSNLDTALGALEKFVGSDFAALLSRAIDGQTAGDSAGPLGTLFSTFGGSYKKASKEIGDTIGKGINDVLGDKLASTLGQTLGTAYAGYELGGQVNNLILGSEKANSTASQIGSGSGAIGGMAIGGPIGSLIGSIVGGIAGSLLEGAFSETHYQKATVTDAGSTIKTFKSKSNVSTQLGEGVTDAVNQIVQQLDATLGKFEVAIGMRNGEYRVTSTATDDGLKSNVIYKGADAEKAMQVAIVNAIEDGAIVGISEAAKRLLTSGQDLDKALSKALSLDKAFKSLKAYTDPLGYALDQLNTSFRQLKQTADEAGLSQAEYAQLQQLYDYQRADAVKQVMQQVTGALQSLYDELAIGDSGLSLRARIANAQAAYDPLASRVAAGDTTAYSDYADAAKTLLDLEREAFGSQDQYFRLLDEVTNLTRGQLDVQNGKLASNDNRVDFTPVVSATESQTAALVAALGSGFSGVINTINGRSSSAGLPAAFNF